MFKRTDVQLSPREEIENKFKSARYNLLLAVIVTAINIFLLLIGTDYYFLFSITVPYVLVSVGMYLCGMFPSEYYDEFTSELVPLDRSVFIVLLVFSLVLLSVYFISWLLSAKYKTAFFILPLVLFAGDTLLALSYYGLSFDCLIEMLFHVWILYYLITGIIASRKLKNLPEDEPEADSIENNDINAADNDEVNSSHLRVADMSTRSRMLAEVDAQNTPFNKPVYYRRVGKVNELIIGNYVYDEYVALMEMPHTLKATINGHTVEASLDNLSRSIIKIDGKTVAKKMRLV